MLHGSVASSATPTPFINYNIGIGWSTIHGTRNLPPSCRLALVKSANISISRDDLDYVYNTELKLFETDAKCCTIDKTITALDYNKATDTIITTGSTNVVEFKSLVATKIYVNPGVGVMSSVVSVNDYTFITGSLGFSKYRPAINLSEHTSINTYKSDVIPMSFTATASQTDFPLTKGLTPTGKVLAGGLLKHLTTDYVILNDGYVKTIHFNVGLAITTLVTIFCIKD